MTHDTQADTPLNQITFQLMQSLLNESFNVIQGSKTAYEIELIEVTELTERKAPKYSWQKDDTEEENTTKQTPFTFVFRFPPSHAAGQGIYHVSHPEKGTFEGIFLVPIAQDENGFYFEAVFT